MVGHPKIVCFQCLLLALSAIVAVSAASPPLVDPQPEPVYVPEPDRRGTLKLFWNCFSTFILCVWTAVHPDVLPVKGHRSINFYKFFMMTWAVVIPELVVCMAVEQLRRAMKIRDLWEQSFEHENEKKYWLGLTGAFFVVMGGYVVETESYNHHVNKAHPILPSRSFSRHLRRSKPIAEQFDYAPLVTTVGPLGFERLLESGKIQRLIREGTLQKHHFDHTVIGDKGNANTISKLLVTVQIFWMIIQSIGRKISGLPVTLLEVHVLIQIIYSIVAYCCWWAKPLDINRPIPLPLDTDDLMGHDLTQPTTDHERDLPFCTEYYEHSEWLYMFFRAAYSVLKYLRRPIEFWASILAIVNGALHLLVWKAYFPTPAERIIWRISGVGLGAFPMIVYFIMSWNEEFDNFFIKMWYYMRFEKRSWIGMMFRSSSMMWELYRESVYDKSSNRKVPIWLRYFLLGICTFSMIFGKGPYFPTWLGGGCRNVGGVKLLLHLGHSLLLNRGSVYQIARLKPLVSRTPLYIWKINAYTLTQQCYTWHMVIRPQPQSRIEQPYALRNMTCPGYPQRFPFYNVHTWNSQESHRGNRSVRTYRPEGSDIESTIMDTRVMPNLATQSTLIPELDSFSRCVECNFSGLRACYAPLVDLGWVQFTLHPARPPTFLQLAVRALATLHLGQEENQLLVTKS
ncbi:hypothetical protein BGW36DRAFT_310877, partial [Talaromyces proteolyticus]